MEWIDVRDKMPTSMQDNCWVVTEDREVCEAYYPGRGNWKDPDTLEGLDIVVTHWMLRPPLPPPPQPRRPFSGHHHKLCGRDYFNLFWDDDSMLVLDVRKATGRHLVNWLNKVCLTK